MNYYEGVRIMKKKLLTIMCVGMLAVSLVGCGKEDKEDKKEKETSTTEESADFDMPDIDVFDSTEDVIDEPTDNPVTEETILDEGWTVVGSDRTGYAELPNDWTEHESEADGGEKYSLQYISPAEDGIVSFLDSDYDYDTNQYDAPDPADVVIDAYVEQYSAMNAVNEGVETANMDGIDFYLTKDSLPEGTYTDYEYVLYTYVAYTNDRFYTVIIEGERSVVEETAERVEATYSISGTSAAGDDVTNEPEEIDDNNQDVSGKTDWETYYASIDGDDYTLPCDLSEFEANGWTMDVSSAGETIDPEDYTYAFLAKGDVVLSVMIANDGTANAIPIEDGIVKGVQFDFHVEDIPCHIEGGIALGTSYDTVIEAFGTPDDVYEDEEEDYKQITYHGATMATDWYTKLEITLENGIVTSIELIHW